MDKKLDETLFQYYKALLTQPGFGVSADLLDKTPEGKKLLEDGIAKRTKARWAVYVSRKASKRHKRNDIELDERPQREDTPLPPRKRLSLVR